MIKRIGYMVTIGLFIQIITSTCFEGLQQFIKTYMTVRDFICLIGQDAGELLYAGALWLVLKKHGVFMAICEFWIALLLVDLFTIIFLNPYEMPPSKFIGFAIATSVLLFRLKKYIGYTAYHTD